jgi:uncharacterized protein YbaR (Trm112 family)
MEENIIVCPNCKTKINVNQVLSQQLEEKIRITYEKRLALEKEKLRKDLKEEIEKEQQELFNRLKEELAEKSKKVQELYLLVSDF